MLADRRIVVTGAGRGLGRAYAIAIAEAGASVVVNDVDVEQAQAVCDEIIGAGGIAIASSHSVSSIDAAGALIEACVKRFGGVDGLVNNAGIFHVASPQEEDAERARRLIDVNVQGVINCGLAAIRHMVAGGGGVILNVVSGAALGISGMSTYGASKGAVLSLTRGWSLDLKDQGVRVLAISPVARTRMSEQFAASKTSLDPVKIGPLAVYLLSEESAHLNGETVRLSGDEVSILAPAYFLPPMRASGGWTVDALTRALQRH